MTTSATIEGQVRRVERRGKQLYCFEGTDLRKVGGRGGVVHVDVGATRYTGELVAIGPIRAIVLIASNRGDHGISTRAVVQPV